MSKTISVHIEKSHEELARFAASQVVSALRAAIKERGTATLVLSGGETPRRMYQLLGSSPPSNQVEWNRIHVFFGDERMVPPDHPDSNYGMAKKEMLDRLSIPADHIHRMKGELKPEEAASEYANVLKALYTNTIPRFDSVFLGIGEDGHTASLFPGTEALREHKRPVVALFVPRLKTWRVTLTFPVINNARNIFVLAEGTKKSVILAKAIESARALPELPITMVRPYDGSLHWLLDVEAAAHLR